MSRRVSTPHHGFANIIARPTDDGTQVALQVGGIRFYLTPDRARRIADLLHDSADDVDHQEKTA